MNTEVWIELQPRVVLLHCRGAFKVDDAFKVIDAAFAIAAREGREAALVDAMDLGGTPPSLLQRFGLGVHVAGRQAEERPRIRIAVAGKEPMIDGRRFGETAARSQGSSRTSPRRLLGYGWKQGQAKLPRQGNQKSRIDRCLGTAFPDKCAQRDPQPSAWYAFAAGLSARFSTASGRLAMDRESLTSPIKHRSALMKSKFASFLAVALGLSVSSFGYAAQPHMEAALASLQQAKESLQAASEDKGGHRVKAIKAINEAVNEVKAGIEFDRAHQSKDEKAAKEEKEKKKAP